MNQQAHPETSDATIDLTFDLTVVDLTDTGGHLDREPDHRTNSNRNVWGLEDDTVVGRFVTPDHVLAARSAYRKVAEGRPLIRSVGTVFQTVAGFADNYVVDHIIHEGDRDIEQPGRPAGAKDLAQAKMIKHARHRLGYFLDLDDEDFLACFRFNGDITGEYLIHVERCERDRIENHSGPAQPAPEPSPKQRRHRKARSLRSM